MWQTIRKKQKKGDFVQNGLAQRDGDLCGDASIVFE
jgi:hypothetical protein